MTTASGITQPAWTEVSRLELDGGQPLYGRVPLAGFKHSMVLFIAYLVGRGGPARLENMPDIHEVDVYEKLLPEIGVHGLRRSPGVLSWESVSRPQGVGVLPQSASQIHGSLYLLPALVAHGAPIAFDGFGGCQIGNEPGGERPWRHVVSVMRRFGAEFDDDPVFGPTVHAAHGFGNADIDLLDYTTDRQRRSGPEYSGATKAALLSAALGRGEAILHNGNAKAELRSMKEFIRDQGVGIEDHGAGEVHVRGGGAAPAPAPTKVTRLPPDLLEAATWITATGLVGGRIRISGLRWPDLIANLQQELDLWRRVGIDIAPGDPDEVVVSAPTIGLLDRMPDVHIHPSGIYSDCHPLFAVLATRCAGETRFVDEVWSKRYAYAEGLRQMGASVAPSGRGLCIGASPLLRAAPAPLHGTDLRCAAAYMLAALRASGHSTITGAHHLHRGYSDLLTKLQALGVNAHVE